MMNKKQAQKWEAIRKNIFLRIAIFMLAVVPLSMIFNYLTHYIIDGHSLSKAELDAKIPMFLSNVYWMTFGSLIASHWQEKRYTKYLEANKAGKK